MGNTFKNCRPVGSIRFVGMMLPGKGAPVSGSVIVIRVPTEFTVLEKLPARSNAVGTLAVPVVVGTFTWVYSWEAKKKNFSRVLLYTLGMVTGPPMLKPPTKYRYRGRA